MRGCFTKRGRIGMWMVAGIAALSASHAGGAVAVSPKDPTLPYDEGNRPQVYLNGLWDFMPLANGTSRAIPDHPPAEFKAAPVKMPVPGWWDNYGEFDIPPEWSRSWNAWYRRDFTIPEAWRGKRWKLRFGAVTQYAKVFVNGRCVGENIHGLTPFSLDITEAARIGANRLEVFVQGYIHALKEGAKVLSAETFVGSNRGSWGMAEFKLVPGSPGGEREVHDLHKSRRGICRDVLLEAVPPIHVQHAAIVTSFRRRAFDVDVRVANESADARRVMLNLVVTDADGKQVLSLDQPTTVPAGKTRKVHLYHPWKAPRFWSHWDPYLYTCTVTVQPEGAPSFDRKRIRFGFREVWIGPRHDILLNGLPLRMMGVDRMDAWATIQTPSYIREFFRQIRRLGFNSIRNLEPMPR